MQRAALELLLEALPLAEGGAQVGDDAGQAGDDEEEQHDGHRGDDRHVDLVAGHPFDDEHRRCHQGGDRQQHEPPGRQPDLGHLDRLRDAGHGRIECGGSPQHGTDEPAGVDDVPGHVRPVERHDRVREVRGQVRRQRTDDQPQRQLAMPGSQHDANEDAEQQDVEHRVGQCDRDLADGRVRIVDDRRHQERPAHQADPDRDDQRVEHAGPVPIRDSAADHPHHRGHGQGHPAEIEGIRDRWERLDAVDPVEHDPGPVSDGHGREAGGEEQPRPAVVRAGR